MKLGMHLGVVKYIDKLSYSLFLCEPRRASYKAKKAENRQNTVTFLKISATISHILGNIAFIIRVLSLPFQFMHNKLRFASKKVNQIEQQTHMGKFIFGQNRLTDLCLMQNLGYIFRAYRRLSYINGKRKV